nr:ABC transporter permease [Nocardiopsis mwathae]
MGSVVALITLLVVLLSGLTAGLADESVSAVDRLPADRIAFGAAGDSAPEESFADSSVTTHQVDTWAAADGVDWAEPLGITPTRLEAPDGSTVAATVFAARPGGRLAPSGTADDGLVIGRKLADEKGLEVGDTLHLGDAELAVTRIGPDSSYSHTPVVWTSLDTWRSSAAAGRSADDAPAGTVVAVGTDGAGADAPDADAIAAIDSDAGTVSATRSDSRSAVGAFSSENGSLLMIQGFLYAISALVVGAFLTVWTIQRSGDIAILKALGGSTGYLLRDALAQALMVLLAGAGAGGLAGLGVGMLAERVVPFSLSAATTALPVAAMVALGMLGAVLSVRRITSVDPLTALGGVR